MPRLMLVESVAVIDNSKPVRWQSSNSNKKNMHADTVMLRSSRFIDGVTTLPYGQQLRYS
jgi:aminopeptidase C